MSTESGLAFVVVMHLSPEFESQLPNVLQQKTKMPVVQVNEPVKVRPNQVYVIPPNKQLTLNDSMMKYRADVSGGKLEIESRRGRGTTVTCRVPLNREK